jgi:uncharacterized protein YicC (UPF0701 family)
VIKIKYQGIKVLKLDFNLLFWKVFGVNQRVYEPLDIFKVKRDKRADEKDYSNFIKSDNLLSNENYFQQFHRETEIFYIFFINYLLGENPLTEFYVHELNNITNNYNFFNNFNLKEEIYINMYSFQIALIIEKMHSEKIDISLFNESLEKNSIQPFINKCKLKTKTKTQKELASEFSYINHKMIENYSNYKIKLDETSPTTFEKDLSKWKKGKEFPSFIKLLVIINTIEKDNSSEKIGIFFQLLVIRSLLYIQQEFKISDKIKNKFSNQLNKFIKQLKKTRDTVGKSNLTSIEDIIVKKQQKYVINFPNYKNHDKDPIANILELLHSRMNEFIKFNYPNKIVDITIADREIIIEKFNRCKINTDYLSLLNDIQDVSQDILYNQTINGYYNFVRFIISIKIKNKTLFNEKYKYLDRSLGTLLSLYGIKKELSSFSKILKDKNDLVECIDLISEYMNKLSTLE